MRTASLACAKVSVHNLPEPTIETPQVVQGLETVDRWPSFRQNRERNVGNFQWFSEVASQKLPKWLAPQLALTTSMGTFFTSKSPMNANGRPGSCTGNREKPLSSLFKA